MDTGQLALDDALDRVERNADEQWLVAADYAVAKVALRKAQLTADDVWEVLDGMDVATHEKRALGPVMDRAAKDGIIANTGTYIKSRRASRHKGPVAVWKSRIYWEDA
jgi:hypothetical protein